MASLNPYHKWLAIPPGEQPPDHYRLLGLPQFESDADVIEMAAEQRTLLLRTFQTGANSELAERLLNEISAARICLLTAAEKAQYDRSLEALVEPESSTSTPTVHQQSRGRPTQKNGWKEPWVLATVAGAVAVILFWTLMNSGNDKSQVAGNLNGKTGVHDRKDQDQLQQQELKKPIQENGENGSVTRDADQSADDSEPSSEGKPVTEPDRALPTLPENKPSTDEKVAPKGQSAEVGGATAKIDQRDDYLALHVLIAPKAKQGDNYNVIVTLAEFSEWEKKLGGVKLGECLGYLRLRPQSGLVPFYRVRTPDMRRYLFRTYAILEAKKAIEWRQKQLGWVAPRDLVQPPQAMVPVYRLTHPKTKQRRFTSNSTTRATLISQGWLQDRILAYLFRDTPPTRDEAKK